MGCLNTEDKARINDILEAIYEVDTDPETFLENYFNIIDGMSEDEKFGTVLASVLVAERYRDWLDQKMEELNKKES